MSIVGQRCWTTHISSLPGVEALVKEHVRVSLGIGYILVALLAVHLPLTLTEPTELVFTLAAGA